MDETQKIGNVGSVEETFTGGVLAAKGTAQLPKTSFGLGVKVTVEADLDSTALIELLASKIGGPVPEAVAKFLETALASVK